MADVDAVHNIVEHVHQLSDDSGHGQLEQKPANRFGAQKFSFIFHIGLPFRFFYKKRRLAPPRFRFD